jgi:DNA-binding MarR family transcriptional regulator
VSHPVSRKPERPSRIIPRNSKEREVENYIALRYTKSVPGEITTQEYRALAELRYRIRHFLGQGDTVARTAGLEPQQYVLLLTIRGLPLGEEATIRTLAERLALKHHSTVELVDRMELHGYVRRNRGREDRRRVVVSLLSKGERLLEEVARQRIEEVRSSGHELARAIDQLLQPSKSPNGIGGKFGKKGRGARDSGIPKNARLH